MRKILLALLFVLGIAAIVYAAPKRVPTTFTADGLVQSGRTIVEDMNIYWSGVTAGASMTLKNSTTATGDAVFTFVADTTAGSVYIPPYARKIVVDTGLYADFNNTGTLGLQIFYQ